MSGLKFREGLFVTYFFLFKTVLKSEIFLSEMLYQEIIKKRLKTKKNVSKNFAFKKVLGLKGLYLC